MTTPDERSGHTSAATERARSAEFGATRKAGAEAGATRSADDGKRALFSSAVRRPGTLVVDCSRCHGRTRLSYKEFAQRHLPYWLWTPWRRFSRYVVCPACGQRAWISARWFE